MPEIQEVKEVAEKESEIAPAEAKKTEEHMIPKSRFDEVNDAKTKAEKELQRLRKQEEDRKDAELSELERLRKQNAELETKQKQLEREQARQKAALEAGLDVTLIDRVKGDTPEEMLEDAKQLAKLLPQKTQKQKLDSANPATNDKGMTDSERAKFLGLRN